MSTTKQVVNIFALIEAINSVAIEHAKDCECVTCRAAHGDQEALARIILAQP